jgi:predicted ATPase/DNA-binding SARP family transcriptional activator
MPGTATSIRLLGSFDVMTDAGPALLGGARQRGVLAQLALHPGRQLSIDVLAAGLWGEDQPATTVNTLQVYVSGLRRAFKSHGIAASINSRRPGYVLEIPFDWVDASDFLRMASEGRAALRSGDARVASSLLEEGLQLWRGPALADLQDLPFAAAASVHLNEQRAAALDDWFEARLLLGEHSGLVAELEVAVTEDPYRELRWAQLMLALYRAGRQVHALSAFQRVRNLLIGELGLEPGPDLAQLEQLILTQDPSLDLAAGKGERLTVLSPPPRPVIARQPLVDEIVQLLERGQRLIGLVGIAGVGKTTVALAVAHEITKRDRPVVLIDLASVRSLPEAMASLTTQLGAEGTTADDLAESLAGVRFVVVIDHPEQMIDELDDVVQFLLLASPSISVMVCSRRSGRIAREQLIDILPLAVTDHEGSPGPAVELFESRAKDVQASFRIDGRTRDRVIDICRRLDGLPLGIEIAAARLRSCTLERLGSEIDQIPTDRSRRLRGGAEQRNLAVLLDQSVADLDDTASLLYRRLSVLRDSFDERLALALAPELGADLALESLETLVGSCLVSPPDEDGRYRMLAIARVHAQERLGLPTETELARSAFSREMLARIDAWGTDSSAVDGAMARLALDTQHVMDALSYLLGAGEHDAAAQAFAKLTKFFLRQGRVDSACQMYSRLDLEKLPSLTAGRAMVAVGTLMSVNGDTRGFDLLDTGLQLSSAGPVDRLVINGWCCMGNCHLLQGDLHAARRAADTARSLAEQSGTRDLMGLAADFSAFVTANAGEYSATLDLLIESLTLHPTADPWERTSRLAMLVEAAAVTGSLEEATAASDEAFELVGTHQLKGLLNAVLISRCLVLVAKGQGPDAVGVARQALRASLEDGPQLGVGDALSMLAAGYAIAGDARSAAQTWGLADTTYRHQTVDPVSRSNPILEEIRARTQTLLGPREFALAFSRGAQADPHTLVGPVEPGRREAVSRDN